MKAKSIVKLVVAIVIVAVIVWVSVFGANITIGSMSYKGFGGILDEESMNLGIDIAGGSILTYQAKTEASDEEMNVVEEVMRKRLTAKGYTEATVSRVQSQNGRIRVEVPGVDASSVASLLGTTAKLTFRDYQDNVIMDGVDVETAAAEYGQVNQTSGNLHYVSLKLTEEGRQKFSAATLTASKLAQGNNIIKIVLDDTTISAPSVSEQISSDSCVISGSFDKQGAEELANLISSGSLPVELDVIGSSNVGAELGEGAYDTALWAALFGILVIMVFMLIFYRLPGLVADIALAGYIGIVCLIIGIFKINLSMSGIAGVILSIGMAVDANVIIFERVKEELKLGKTIRSAVDSGFHRALGAIIDGNITTLIAAAVLWMSGVATVQGFAVTLFIGVVVSMLTAIFVTRFLLRQIVGLNIGNPKIYGA